MTHRPELPELPDLPDRPERGAMLAEPDRAVFDRIESTLFDRIEGSERARGARHRLVAAASAVVLLGVGGAAWVALATPQLRATSTYCYEAADTSSEYTQVGPASESFDEFGNATPIPYPEDRFSAALDNCAGVWRIGFFGNTPTDANMQMDAANEHTVPDLIVCLRPDQVPAVFPRDAEPGSSTGSESASEADREFCFDLGLLSPPDE